MKYAIIIPTFEKTLPYLTKCVTSLRDSGCTADIIVVSNGSESPYPINIPGITMRLHNKQQGQCNAVNIGAQMVNPTTEYIMVSNDDMYYAPGWDAKLRFDHKCFSPNLVEPTDNGGSAAPFEKFDGGLTLEYFKEDAVNDRVNVLVHYKEEPIEETGFNLPFFIRKDVWDTIGGYDTKYDPWGSNSDTDLQTLIELAGIQPMRLRDVLVYHFGQKSGTFNPDHQAFWQKNWDYYTNKWGFNRDDDPKPDTWMALNMVNKEKNKFHPDWEGRYEDTLDR